MLDLNYHECGLAQTQSAQSEKSTGFCSFFFLFNLNYARDKGIVR